jgi:nicotinamidase/pyrazinamidase
METESFVRKDLEMLTDGALRRACRRLGAVEDFLDPVSGGDPAKEDLLAFLEANWGTSPGATQPDAQPEEDVASRVSSSPTCRPVDFHKSKTNSFPLASEHVPHNSMGASAVLDGCPVKEDHDDAALFIIDPQIDFHEGGNLGVAGATADSERIADLIRRHPYQIDHIIVSLDAHHRVHIAHGGFWTDAGGCSPEPFTQISHADVVAGKWTAREPELQRWALEYTASLEEGGRFTHIIWPYHCLIGTPGHAVSPALLPALDEWSEIRSRAVTWVLKGQNNRTEMYSALKAEVPVADDPATHLNLQLIDTLASHSQVVICGQAKSHCVNFTTRDLLSAWPQGRPTADICVLEDATSPVAGCEAEADLFFDDMRKAGVTLVAAAEWVPRRSSEQA